MSERWAKWDLIGQQIFEVRFEDDILYLRTEDYRVVMYNKAELSTGPRGDANASYDVLLGQRIIKEELTDECFCLHLETASLAVSLKPEDYQGPEAVDISRIGNTGIWVF